MFAGETMQGPTTRSWRVQVWNGLETGGKRRRLNKNQNHNDMQFFLGESMGKKYEMESGSSEAEPASVWRTCLLTWFGHYLEK